MVIAALISFGILLVAWILAPSDRSPEPASVGDPQPTTAAA